MPIYDDDDDGTEREVFAIRKQHHSTANYTVGWSRRWSSFSLLFIASVLLRLGKSSPMTRAEVQPRGTPLTRHLTETACGSLSFLDTTRNDGSMPE
jgi:hypothetical protein